MCVKRDLPGGRAAVFLFPLLGHNPHHPCERILWVSGVPGTGPGEAVLIRSRWQVCGEREEAVSSCPGELIPF